MRTNSNTRTTSTTRRGRRSRTQNSTTTRRNRSTMSNDHRTSLFKMVARIRGRKRNNGVNYAAITAEFNRRNKSNYSVYVISAMLGRAQIRQTAATSSTS